MIHLFLSKLPPVGGKHFFCCFFSFTGFPLKPATEEEFLGPELDCGINSVTSFFSDVKHLRMGNMLIAYAAGEPALDVVCT